MGTAKREGEATGGKTDGSKQKKGKSGKSKGEIKAELGTKAAMGFCGLEARVRALESVAFETAFVDMNHAIPAPMQKTGVQYDKSVRSASNKDARREILKVGRHLYFFAEALQLLKPTADKETLDWIDKMIAKPALLRGQVKYFRRLRPNKQGFCRIMVAIPGNTAQFAWGKMKEMMMATAGTEFFDGMASKGPLARDIERDMVELGIWTASTAGGPSESM